MNNAVISRTTRFNEALNRLRLSGGIAANAAKDATGVMGNVISMPAGKPEQYGRLTKNGESRIKHCFKYDLTGGYRLITVKIKDTVFLLFVGTHEEADRWLDKNRGLEPIINRDGKITIVEGKEFASRVELPMPPDTVLPEKTLLSYLSPDELDFLRLGSSGVSLTHFSSDDEILAVIDASPSETSNVLLDVLIHLRDYKIDSAKGVIDLAIGNAQPLADFQGDIATEIKKNVNRESLINLRDLSETEYNQILNGSLSDWMLYLHPDQRGVAFDDYEGTVRLQGVAGSGKTSVLLHRAKYLAEKYETQRIAIFTLNPSLAALIRDLLKDLAAEDVCKRIEVYDLESFARALIGKFLPQQLLLTYDPRSTEILEDCFWDSYEKPEQVETLRDVCNYLRNRKVNIERYLRDEFVWVRSAFRSRTDYSTYTTVPSRDVYLDTTASRREGRSIPFTAEYRSAILAALQFYEEHMEAGGFADQAAVTLLAHSCIDKIKAQDSPFRYRSVLVDEVQDLSTVEIELVSACAAADENGLFFVGDPEQQVYPKEHNLRKAGVAVAARRFFRKNYRNPRQILETALELLRLHGQQGIDEDDKLGMLPEYAARESARPLLVKCVDDDDQMSFLVDFVSRRLAESEAAICLILCGAREDDDTKISDFAAQLHQKGLSTELLRGIKTVQPKTVYLSGLETVKGFEFSRVFIVGIGEQFPAPDLPQEEAWRDVRRLYVALTRARDEVILTYTNQKSPCLVGLEELLSETSSGEQIDGGASTSNASETMAAQAPRSPDVMTAALSPNVSATPEVPILPQIKNSDLPAFFRNSKLEVYDKRDRGGCLWVVGGPGLQSTMGKLKSAGFRFNFTPNGSRTTKYRPAWYLK